MAKKIASINSIKKRLKKVLENQGNYIEGIDTLLETTAGMLHVYFLAMNDIESLESSFVEEITREGNIKLAPHPAIKVAREQAEMVRRQLRELRLTIATVEGVNDDDMDDLMDSVNSVE